jgi:outer membrane receptor protein involved in Fe transport
MKLDFRQRLLATTLMVGASMLATPAFAQDTPAPENPTGPVEAQPPEAAQPTEAGATQEDAGRDIVVTGTRIPQANLESVAPVTVVSDQDLKLQGTARVEDLLNSLPSVFAAQASTISNGADGTATVDLRGLGAKRTLVLVNGRRLVPGSPVTAGPADINIIPSAIVKRVEVLTGGASSTYGADAVSGVVNFIMDTNFEGIKFDGQYSFYQHTNRDRNLGTGSSMYDILNARQAQGLDGYGYPTGSVVDGGAFDGTVTIGAGFDDNRGHVTAYFGYRNVNPVLQSRRDYSACTIQNTSSGGSQCGGSLTNAFGNVIYFVTGTSTVYNLAADAPGAGPRYNFAPTNYFQRPDERYTAGLFANYEITPAIKPYLEFMFMDDRSVAQIAPSGDFGNTLTVNCDNPLLTANQFDVMCDPLGSNNGQSLINGFIGNFPVAVGAPFNPNPGAAPIDFFDPLTGTTYNKAFFQLLRRNIEGGPRQQDTKYQTFRGVLGSKGDLGSAWSYDAYYQYGRVNYEQTYRNEFSVARLNRALDVVTDTRPGSPTFGQPVCRSVTDGTDANCVPYDVFNDNISDAAVNYLAATGLQNGQTSEQVAHADFTGLLGEYGIKTPWAEDGVAINLGAEYRKERLELDVDNAFATGDLTGQGAPTLPIKGSFRVIEFFGETQVPIVQRSFIHDLTLTAGYRRSYYETSEGDNFDTNTYKIGLEFAPIQDIRFRAGYNRAVRAPNIQELFATQFVGLDGTEDPCADIPGGVTATDYGCLAQGLVIGQSPTGNPAGQYNGLLGGNPDLQPEKATTKTIGVILQPSFIPRLALTIDWFSIKVEDAIQGFGADAILQDCTDGATAVFTPDSCALVQRDPSGSLWLTSGGFVIDTPHNIGGVHTKGFEFNGSYSHRLGNMGNLSASMVGTLLRKFETDNGLTPAYDCKGLYGSTCLTPAPEWRHKARLTWNMPSGIGLSMQWRYIGGVKADSTSDNPSLSGPLNYNPGAKIGDESYIDLAATFTFGDHYNFRLGVNNVFDNMPPLTTSGNASGGGSDCPTGPCNGNTWPATWDALGRYIYAGVTLDF